MDSYNEVNDVFKLSREIFSHIVDKYSEEIFTKRLLYSLTGNIQHLYDMIVDTRVGKNFVDNLNRADRMVFFGAGEYGKTLYKIWKPAQCDGFIDNNEHIQGQKICGLNVYSLAEYLKLGGGYFFFQPNCIMPT